MLLETFVAFGLRSYLLVWLLTFFPVKLWSGTLHQNAPQNLSAGTVGNLVTWPEIAQMKASATPVGRQDTVPETAQLLSCLLVTWGCAIIASSKGTWPPTAPMTRPARTVGKLVILHVIVKMSPCAICAIYLGMLLETAPRPMCSKRGVVVEFAEVDYGTLYVGTASRWGIWVEIALRWPYATTAEEEGTSHLNAHLGGSWTAFPEGTRATIFWLVFWKVRNSSFPVSVRVMLMLHTR